MFLLITSSAGDHLHRDSGALCDRCVMWGSSVFFRSYMYLIVCTALSACLLLAGTGSSGVAEPVALCKVCKSSGGDLGTIVTPDRESQGCHVWQT